MAAHGLIYNGVRRKIGNGAFTLVWGHPWLLDDLNPMIQTVMAHHLCGSRVLGLIDWEIQFWDLLALRDIILTRDTFSSWFGNILEVLAESVLVKVVAVISHFSYNSLLLETLWSNDTWLHPHMGGGGWVRASMEVILALHLVEKVAMNSVLHPTRVNSTQKKKSTE
uniref:Uncharacterized protein n=1 Tax=Ipomoea trifida TaxID=35884 RepID=A0PAB8_IPOTF|nr:hypothetical protein [Ipomoea trifida]